MARIDRVVRQSGLSQCILIPDAGASPSLPCWRRTAEFLGWHHPRPSLEWESSLSHNGRAVRGKKLPCSLERLRFRIYCSCRAQLSHSADTLPETAEGFERGQQMLRRHAVLVVEMKAHVYGFLHACEPGQARLPGCSVEVLSSVTRRRVLRNRLSSHLFTGLSLVETLQISRWDSVSLSMPAVSSQDPHSSHLHGGIPKLLCS